MPICIAGMHRSGTSLVARILREATLDLGADADLLPGGDGNPEGHFEHVRFLAINDALLAHAGGTWHSVPPREIAWEHAPARLQEEAARLVATFAGREPWGWKDPRNSLTIAFWRRLVPDLKVVVCVRHPVEVAQSLNARNGLLGPVGVQLWLDYYTRLFAGATADCRLITHYDSYFADPIAETRRLLRFAGLPFSDALTSLPRSELRHSRRTLSDLIDGPVDLGLARDYLSVCSEAGPSFMRLLEADLLGAFGPGPFPGPLGDLAVQLAEHKRDLACWKTHASQLSAALEYTTGERDTLRAQVADLSEQMTWRRHRWANNLAEFLQKLRRFVRRN